MGHSAVRSGSSEENEPSKNTRKFDKKVKFYSKVRDTVASLRANKEIGKKKLRSRQKKLKAYDLASLNELLPELESSGQQADPTNLKLNNKNRLKLVEKEGKQFKAVLSNSVFQSDPLAAILHHLEQTQPSPPVEEPKKKKNKNGSTKRKKLKASSSSHAMEL